MSGSAHYLEPKFLSELAYEVAGLESVSKDLKEADLTKEKLVEEILKEPELSESIKVAISDKVAEADRLEKEIDDLQHEIRDFGEITHSFGPSLSVMFYIAPFVLIPFLTFAWAAWIVSPEWLPITEKLQIALVAWPVLALIIFVIISLPLLGHFMARSPEAARKPVRDETMATRAQIEQRIKKATAEQNEKISEIPETVRDDVLTPIARKILERLIFVRTFSSRRGGSARRSLGPEVRNRNKTPQRARAAALPDERRQHWDFRVARRR